MADEEQQPLTGWRRGHWARAQHRAATYFDGWAGTLGTERYGVRPGRVSSPSAAGEPSVQRKRRRGSSPALALATRPHHSLAPVRSTMMTAHSRFAVTPDEKGSACPSPSTPRGPLARVQVHTYHSYTRSPVPTVVPACARAYPRRPLSLTPSRPISAGVSYPEEKPRGATSEWGREGARSSGAALGGRRSRRRSPTAAVRW